MKEDGIDIENSRLTQVFAAAGCVIGLIAAHYAPEMVMCNSAQLGNLQAAAIIFMPMLGFLEGERLGNAIQRQGDEDGPEPPMP